MRLHRGRVEVVSEPGAGTTFTIHLATGAGHLPAEKVGAAPALICSSTPASISCPPSWRSSTGTPPRAFTLAGRARRWTSTPRLAHDALLAVESRVNCVVVENRPVSLSFEDAGTGEIGPILIRKVERVRKAVRLEFLCGGRAVRRARADLDLLSRLAGAYSASPDDLPGVLEAERAELKESGAARREPRA